MSLKENKGFSLNGKKIFLNLSNSR